MKLILTYDPDNGPATRDGQCLKTAESMISLRGNWTTGNFHLIEHLRLMIKNGDIQHEDVVFKFGNDVIFVNKNGTMDHWPKGFGDAEINILEKLLGWDTAGNCACGEDH